MVHCMSSGIAPQKNPPLHLLDRKGALAAERVGLRKSFWSDLYHLLLTTSWIKLIGAVLALYAMVNVLFAFLYWLGSPCIEGARPGHFLDLFFFSVQTMGTIGYGKMSPATTWAHSLVTIEAILGLLGLALASGLMFAKFSNPTARVLFSKWATISKRNGVPCLMIRLANQRNNQVVEATLRITLVRAETTLEGESVRRFYDVHLQHERSAIFALTWTAIHPITPESPFYGVDVEILRQERAFLLVSLVGIDEVLSQTTHARKLYTMYDVREGYRFVDILSTLPDGRVRVNYTKFDDVQPAAA